MAGQTVTIRKGDTIYSIARKYGVSPSALMFINNIKDTGNIKPGQVLKIPVINPVSQKGVTAGLDSVHFSRKPAAKAVQTSVQNNPKTLKTPTITAKPSTKPNPFASKTSVAVKPPKVEKKPITTKNTNFTIDQIKDRIRAEAKRQGVDENFALAVVEQESQFKPNAKSPTGAVGLFQLTKIAAKQVNGEKTYDIDKNINYGTKYLKWCLDHTKTKEEALVAYNRGLTAMNKAKRNGTPIDSITDKKNGLGFAKNVLDIYEKYKKV